MINLFRVELCICRKGCKSFRHETFTNNSNREFKILRSYKNTCVA